MSSVGHQMPALYLRGSLCNVTMKNLTKEEVIEFGTIVESIANDRLLQPCRSQFKDALANTIGGDYKSNRDVSAEQEYMVAIWKATVAAKKGWGKNPPCPETLSDPTQRKKFFQTWVFNYLRQILNENKRAIIKHDEQSSVPVIEAFKTNISALIDNVKFTTDRKHTTAIVDMYLCPAEVVRKVHNLSNTYLSRGIAINVGNDSITIENTLEHTEISKKIETRVNIISTSSKNDDNQSMELESMNIKLEDPDSIDTFIAQLSDEAQQVVSIILNPPDDYISKYNTDKPVRKYIVDYLGLKPKETKRIYEELRMRYAQLVG